MSVRPVSNSDFHEVREENQASNSYREEERSWKDVGILVGKVVLAIIFSIPLAIYCLIKNHRKIGSWTYRKILTPIGHALTIPLKFLFVTLPKLFGNYVLKPIGIGIRNAAVWTYQNMARPLARALAASAKFLFVTLPKFFWNSVLRPAGKGLRSAVLATYQHVLTPIGHAFSATAEFLFKVLASLGRVIAQGATQGAAAIGEGAAWVGRQITSIPDALHQTSVRLGFVRA